jgi:hypothetical protein
MVLCCRAHHRRASDVDLLNTLIRAGSASDRFGEWVQVHDHKLERRYAVVGQLLKVIREAGVGQNPSVYAGVQSLDTTAEHLREIS